jgi:hypothetical protein
MRLCLTWKEEYKYAARSCGSSLHPGLSIHRLSKSYSDVNLIPHLQYTPPYPRFKPVQTTIPKCPTKNPGSSVSAVRPAPFSIPYFLILTTYTAHCSVRGFSKPIFQDVSDRRGISPFFSNHLSLPTPHPLLTLQRWQNRVVNNRQHQRHDIPRTLLLRRRVHGAGKRGCGRGGAQEPDGHHERGHCTAAGEFLCEERTGTASLNDFIERAWYMGWGIERKVAGRERVRNSSRSFGNSLGCGEGRFSFVWRMFGCFAATSRF